MALPAHTVSPGLVDAQSGQVVTINGTDFRAPVTVEATCRKTGEPEMVVAATVGTTTATSIETTWDMSGLAGFVCVLRVTNTDNGTFSDFSAISVTNPSANLNPFQQDTIMIEPRRALASAAIRMNNSQRYLFAIGGDTGDDGVNPVVRHASVESAPVNAYGAADTWTIQRNALPETRNFFAATVVERFVYVAGGRTGDDPGVVDNKVLRAYLLDPFEAPEITDLTLSQSEFGGLDAGTWYYKVAAVMGPSDPNNPDGEALPSEPLTIEVPAGVSLTFFWDGIPGAVEYKVYRTTAPNQFAGSERLLATVTHSGAGTEKQSYTDTGADNSAATVTPYPLGSLGVWHQVGTLATAREGAAIVAAPDPNSATDHYLYVVGGRDSTGTALAGYEYATVTATASNDQTISSIQAGASTLTTPRWQLGAVFADSERSGAIAVTDSWIYVLSGLDAAGNSVGDVTAFQIDTADGTGNDDGALGAAVEVTSIGGNPGGGYGYVAGNNYLFQIGAQSGAPSATSRSAKMCQPLDNCGGGAIVPPDILNWNAGIALNEDRYLHGTAVESAFIFILGGQTDLEQATRSTERTNM